MTDQLCGRCGTALAPEGCPCGWSGSNEETAVIPVIGGPELVRPYFRPDDSELDDPDLDLDPDLDGDLDGDLDDVEIVDAELLDVPGHRPMSAAAGGAGADGAGGAGATRVLPAYLPAQRPVEPLGSVVVTRPTPGGPPGRGRRQPRSTRSTVLIAAGIVLIAGIGVAAALVPKMLGGGQVNIAQPQPEITAPLPSQGPTSGSAQPSATATSSASTRSVPVTQPTRPAATSARPTIAPTTAQPTATASGPAAGTPSSASASASADPSGSAASGSLSLGDTGPAVATLQQDLATLWIDPGLQDNGDYNQQTEKDVATFQYWYGVQGDPTGVYGPNSQARMAKLMRHQNGGDNG